MVKKLYFDESGFTGYNYLDPLQPIFSLASTDLSPEQSEELLKRTFPKYNGDEYKFSNLWKARRNNFCDLAKNLEHHGNGIKFWVIDKRFAVLVKMVDFLIEPAVTESGYDFLADGFGRKLTNHFHFGLTNFGTQGVLDELITAYQLFSRNPLQDSLKDFAISIQEIYQKQNIEIKGLLGQMVDGVINFERYSNLETFKSTNDLQFTAMLGAVIDWRKDFTEDFSIIHDTSSNFLRQKEIWKNVTGSNVPEQLHPLGDGTFVKFPLRVLDTIPVDSKDNYSVQLADLLAGYASKHFDGNQSEEDRKILDGMVSAGLYTSTFNGIRPGFEFPVGSPRKLNGPDAVDLMSKMIKGDNI